LTRDERLQYLTLRTHTGLTYVQIAKKLGFTPRQVQHACEAGHPTPGKRSGRPHVLTPEQLDSIKVFICSSRSNRLLDFFTLANGPFAHLSVSKETLYRAIQRRSYNRYVARAKPVLSTKNK
ncbi:hypothetical protein B0J12DRAFT_529520, partial [Macrophomina phaseolina]